VRGATTVAAEGHRRRRTGAHRASGEIKNGGRGREHIDQRRQGKRAGTEQKRSETHGEALRVRRWQGEDKGHRLAKRGHLAMFVDISTLSSWSAIARSREESLAARMLWAVRMEITEAITPSARISAL
jgi:hypothetical protein